MNINLEALIEEHAKIMADQMVKAVEWAGSEEDIRHECNKLIDEFIQKAGLADTVKGHHEYGLAGKRGDSKYGRVVIEYKAPKGAGRLTQEKAGPGVKAVVQQIEQRFRDLQAKEHVGMERIFGVGCDGGTFVFVRQRGRVIEAEDPQPVTPYSVEQLLRAIVSVGARGLSFTPENLAARFGSESNSGREGVHRLHEVIHETDNPKAQIFFRQWRIFFSEVCGYDIHGQDAKVSKLAGDYSVPNPNPAELLFAIHTYYALFIKLLAAEIAASFSPLGTSPLKRLVAAPTSAKLRDELRALEQGGIWSQLGIRNFLEGDLFSWYLDAWDDRCAKAVRAMTQALYEFDPTTLSVDPAESRDLLKQLYHQLFPKSVRHDLGEYYTPDWLAELVLNELGYDGDPDKRLLDPACGSGTFLVMALNRVKTWFAEHRHQCGFGEDELLRKVLRNIIGFDLNPLAVMAARTNYLMAIRDLLRHADNVELPVYLCDSIMIPSEYGELWETVEGRGRVARQLKTAAGVFRIPNEIAENRDQICCYADTLKSCVEEGYSPEEFLERCKTEGIPTSEAELHRELYRQLQELETAGENRVWPWIIKNAFAPLFVGEVDLIAGNPPWVNWEHLPDEYRLSVRDTMQKYGLMSAKGWAARLGSAKYDLSMLFVYVGISHYLKRQGRLAFVITQSPLQSDAGTGFRRFQAFHQGKPCPFAPTIAHDMTSFQPFEMASNRTAVIVFQKGRNPTYPVPYRIWKPSSHIYPHMTLYDVLRAVQVKTAQASPVDPDAATSRWLVTSDDSESNLEKVLGKSSYVAKMGSNTEGANGVFWIDILESTGRNAVLIRNITKGLKRPVEQEIKTVERDFIRPLVRSGDIRRWGCTPRAYILFLSKHRRAELAESALKRNCPLLYSYLKPFETILETRKSFAGKMKKQGYPFYTMYGSETMEARFKVLWNRMGSVVNAAVVEEYNDNFLGRVSPVPQETLIYVPVSSRTEAHFLCAMLNSSPVTRTAQSYSLKGSKSFASVHLLENIAIPRFEKGNKNHVFLSEASRRCHAAATKGDTDAVAALETEIDRAAARLWGITDDELRAIQDALAEMSPRATASQTQDESEDA